MTETLTGGCLCGAVRYRAATDETLHYVCHCTDCQRYSGGAHHAAIVVAADVLTVTGAPRHYLHRAESGRSIARYFCDACGGHLFTSPWPDVTRYSVKYGTLDEPAAFAPAAEIWARSRASWAGDSTAPSAYQQGFTGPVTIGAKPGTDT